MKRRMNKNMKINEDLKWQVDSKAEYLLEASMEELYDDINPLVADIHKLLGLDGEYLGCRVQITIGGPSIWIETFHNEIVGYWGNNTYRRSISNEISSKVDFIVSELYIN